MNSAKGSDGAYHFYCRGVLSRLNGRSCSSNDRGSASRARPGRPSSTPISSDPGDDEVLSLDGEDAPSRAPQTDEERRKRRDEIRERLRQKREERTRTDPAIPAPPPADDPNLDDEGPFEDEEGFEDLIPEDLLDEGLDGEIIDEGEP